MLATVTGYLTNAVVTGAVGLVLGTLFGQKIKDWVAGVPAEFRASMAAVEAKAKADVKAAIADVFAKLTPAAPKVAPAPAPAPAAPAAH